ncbi:MAG: teicoplanin resistance protein VanZ [Sphingomonas sp.]|nr:teicoplanin resistance protein VanZ [Sphingomonas sp.]
MAMIERLARPLFWAALIFAYGAAIMPQAEAPHIAASDKIEHMIAFFTLALLAGLGWPRRALWRTGLGLAGVGAAIEITQAIPMLHRDANAMDFLADCAAILFGLGIIAAIRLLPAYRAPTN